MSSRSRVAMKRYYGNKFYIKNKSEVKLEITEFKEASAVPSLDRMSTLYVSITNNWIDTKSKYISRRAKRFILTTASFCFIIYGLAQFVLVMIHFETAKTYCSSVIDNLDQYPESYHNASNGLQIRNILNQSPELLLWDKCIHQTYPFSFQRNGNVCQCRQFRANNIDNDWDDNILQHKFRLTFAEIQTSIFKNWYMLEKYQWNFLNHYRKGFKFSDDMFTSKYLRVIELSRWNLTYIDDKISNWNMLEYIQFTQMANIPLFPSSMSKLVNVKYFVVSPFTNSFPNWFCSMTKLQKLSVYNSAKITHIPFCINNLQSLQSLSLTSATNLKYIPLTLINMSMPKLIDLEISFTAITLNTLIEYNNITIEEFNQQFIWNTEAAYRCELTPFCSNAILNVSNIFARFLNDTNCCKMGCKDELSSYSCVVDDWQNGVCEDYCNNPSCYFDGGDCHQLCDFDKCSLSLLGNGKCDPECNNENCNYDAYDCVQFNDTLCAVTYDKHGCNVSWVNDGYCDNKCQNSMECGYDGDDCNRGCFSECESIFKLFQFPANYITVDNYASLEEVCSETVWSIVEKNDKVKHNCSQTFFLFDNNEDGKATLKEFIMGIHDIYLSITLEKAKQIDCSQCLTSGR
eukprot:147316_1